MHRSTENGELAGDAVDGGQRRVGRQVPQADGHRVAGAGLRRGRGRRPGGRGRGRGRRLRTAQDQSAAAGQGRPRQEPAAAAGRRPPTQVLLPSRAQTETAGATKVNGSVDFERIIIRSVFVVHIFKVFFGLTVFIFEDLVRNDWTCFPCFH